jgi:hypothetical protein
LVGGAASWPVRCASLTQCKAPLALAAAHCACRAPAPVLRCKPVAWEDGEEGAAADGAAVARQLQIGKPTEEDLASMGHHPTVDTVPDEIMQRVGAKNVRPAPRARARLTAHGLNPL